MSSPTAEHALTQIGAPFFSMPIPFAPFALRGKLLVGPVPWTIDSLDHVGDMPRCVGGQLRGKAVNDMAMNSPICVGTGKGVGRDHQVCLRVVQPVSQSCDAHGDVSRLIGESAMPLDFCGEGDVVLLFYGPIYCGHVKLSVVEKEILPSVVGSMGDLFWSSVERSRVGQTVSPIGHKELGAKSH